MCQTSFFRFIGRAVLAMTLTASLSFALPRLFAARSAQPSTDSGPRITSLLPNPIPLGLDVTLTVRGTGFTGDSKVVWNGLRLDDTKLSADKQVLTATVRANQISQAGSAKVSVTDPTGTSQTLQVMIGNGDGQRWRATSGSGVFRSKDKGLTWNSYNAKLGNPSVTALALGPANLFAATEQGIYRTPPKADGWEAKTEAVPPSSTAITLLCVRPKGRLLAGTDYGIFLSTDEGASWKDMAESFKPLRVTAFSGNSDPLLAATDDGTILALLDESTTSERWEKKGGKIPGNLPARALLAVGNTYYAGTDNGIFLSTDAGLTWKESSDGLTSLAVMTLATTDNRIYAGTEEGGVFVSKDKGQKWEPLNEGLRDLHITTLAANSSYLLAGTRNGVFAFARPTTPDPLTDPTKPNPTKPPITTIPYGPFPIGLPPGVMGVQPSNPMIARPGEPDVSVPPPGRRSRPIRARTI